jgi:DNA-binding MarR family transcriptional regulator
VDSVDKMIRQWGERRPNLDVSQLAVVGRLLRCARHLEQDLVAALAPLGLSYGDFDVLNTLRRMGAPAGTNPRELARAALVTSGAMTARLDRLADAGLVERTPDPADRRAVLITLTEAGTRLADDALAAVLAADDTFLAPLSGADRDLAAALLERLLAPYEVSTAG